MKWTNINVIKLIDMYRDRPVLWDCRLEDYKNKNKRSDALLKISVSFRLEKSEIERKIKNLVSHFARECKKEKENTKSGAGADTCYKSKWFAYKSMQFLRDRNKPREAADTELQPTSHQEEEEKGENQDTPPIEEHEGVVETQNKIHDISSTSRSFKRKRESQFTTPIMNEAINILKSLQSKKQEKDEFGVFAEQIAIKLRKLASPHARFIVQSIISKTLFEEEMGKYDGHVFQFQQYQLPSPAPAPMYHYPQPNNHVNYSTYVQPPHSSPCPSTSTTQSESYVFVETVSPRSSVTDSNQDSQDIDTFLYDL